MDRIRALPRQVPFALIACAMLLRLLVPAGWMPTTGADGVLRIAMCGGMDMQSIAIDRAGRHHKDAPSSGHHDLQPCAFGALGLALDAVPALDLSLPGVAVAAVVRVARPTLGIGHGLAAPPPPSTGPPSLT